MRVYHARVSCACIMRTRNTHARTREIWKNGRLYAWPYNGGSAGSLQRSGFRENPTNFLTFVARRVCDSGLKTNRRS